MLKIQGHNGLDDRPGFKPENTLVVPVSLTSENAALKELSIEVTRLGGQQAKADSSEH